MACTTRWEVKRSKRFLTQTNHYSDEELLHADFDEEAVSVTIPMIWSGVEEGAISSSSICSISGLLLASQDADSRFEASMYLAGPSM